MLTQEVKEKLSISVKEWVKCDNEIQLLKKEVKERNERKKALSENLLKTMKANNITCFDLHDGALVYKKSKTTKAISAKTLLEALQDFYKDHPERAQEVAQHVLDSREIVEKDVILRKIDKD